jgi:sugar phosphate isomerase/epimerase
MQLGIFAKTFVRPKFEEALDALASYGLTHVQFNMSCVGLPTLPDRIDEDLCRSIARAHRERGLTMAAISGTFNICDLDILRLHDNLRRLDVLAGACRWLDTRIVTLCTGTLDTDDMWKHHPYNVGRRAWETLLKSMGEAVKIADRHEITLAFEPEIHNVVSSAMRARKLLDEIGSPWLKIVIDPTNLFRPGEARPFSELLCEAFDWLGPDIVLAHAKPPQFGEHAGATEWLAEFLGEKYREMRPRREEPTGGARYLEPHMEDSCGRHSFFQAYAAALERIRYKGACIIHGVEEFEVGDLATRLRHNFNISKAT